MKKREMTSLGKCKDTLLKIYHPFVKMGYTLHRSFDLQVEGTIPEGQPYIYVANHGCVHDIPTATEVIGKHTYVLVSKVDRFSFDGLALSVNGIIWVNRLDKADRARARADLVTLLKAGNNVLIYPESTWNLTPDLLMMKMNWGCIGIAKETGIPIVPLYFLFTDNGCFAKIGQPFVPEGDDAECIRTLRDRMSTLGYELMEKHAQAERSRLGDYGDCFRQFIKERYDVYARARKDPVGVRAYESQFIFKDKDITEYDEAFAHLGTISPSRANAFLFNKRLT